MVGVHLPIDLAGFLRVEVMQLNAHGLIDEDDLPAIRGPGGIVAKAGSKFREDFFLPRAIRGANGEFVFAGSVREISDRFAVGGPGRITFSHTGTARQVASNAMFSRNGEEISPGFEGHAFAPG